MKPERHAATKIALLFGGVSVLWILFSDAAVSLLPQAVALQLQTVKGLLFVLVTTGTLYLLVKRYSLRVDAALNRALVSEQALSDLVATAPVGVVRLDADHVVSFINPEGVGLLGLTTTEIVGNRLCDLLKGRPGADELCAWLASDIDEGVIVSGRDGEPRALMARATRIADPGGSSRIVAFSDVTDSHVSTERFERVVALHGYLARAAEAALAVTDLHSLLATQVELATELGGFHGALGVELGGSAPAVVRVFESPDHPSRSRQSINQMVLSPKMLAADGRGLVVFNDIASDVLNPLADIAAEQGAGSAAVVSLSRDESLGGAVILFAEGVGYFDTDVIGALHALAASLELAYRGLDSERARGAHGSVDSSLHIEHLPLPAFLIDRGTLGLLAANAAAVARFGYDPRDFSGLTIMDVGPAEQAARLRLAFDTTPDGRTPMGRWQLTPKAGAVFSATLYCGSHDRDGRSLLTVIVVEDA